jgi:integrase
MTGHIRRRGEHSWELKFDLGTDSLTGKRLTRYHSFKGTKRDAEKELVRLKAAVDRGEYVDPSKLTLGEFLDRWEAWAATQVSAKTLERYRELAKHHVRPHLGFGNIQKLRPVNFAELYGKLQRAKPEGAGLAPLTIGHVHRLMHRVLGYAVKWGVIVTNPVTVADPPRVQRREIDILAPDEIKAILHGLRGKSLYPVAVIALATGMRRGEIVALRWGDVDLEAGTIRIERSLEQTGTSLVFKEPKTKAGRRAIAIPPSIVMELRNHWRQQQEIRLALGLGKATSDDLVVPRFDGRPWPPDRLSTTWPKTIARLKLPKVSLHALRHTHASQLIAAGLDVVTVSRRLGHSNPTVTLNVYAHLFGNTDERAAAAVEAVLASALKWPDLERIEHDVRTV